MSYKHHSHHPQTSARNADSLAQLAKVIATDTTHKAHLYESHDEALTAARALPTLEEFRAALPPKLCADCSRYYLQVVA
jgi:hypothetical protein